jgi:sugar phosphate permease
VLIGAVTTSLGTGLLLPGLLTWALAALTFEQRGRGTGLWTGSLFVGQFICPILLLAIGHVVGGLSTMGVAALVMTIALLTALRPGTEPQ